MTQLSREEFTDKVQDYIKRINQIAEEQGYSVMMAYYIAGERRTILLSIGEIWHSMIICTRCRVGRRM